MVKNIQKKRMFRICMKFAKLKLEFSYKKVKNENVFKLVTKLVLPLFHTTSYLII